LWVVVIVHAPESVVYCMGQWQEAGAPPFEQGAPFRCLHRIIETQDPGQINSEAKRRKITQHSTYTGTGIGAL
jgi:hypothetical protein